VFRCAALHARSSGRDETGIGVAALWKAEESLDARSRAALARLRWFIASMLRAGPFGPRGRCSSSMSNPSRQAGTVAMAWLPLPHRLGRGRRREPGTGHHKLQTPRHSVPRMLLQMLLRNCWVESWLGGIRPETALRKEHSDLRIDRWARQGSNLRPRDYESPALTAELRAPRWHARRFRPSALCRLGAVRHRTATEGRGEAYA
jgi:hypothetical protein